MNQPISILENQNYPKQENLNNHNVIKKRSLHFSSDTDNASTCKAHKWPIVENNLTGNIIFCFISTWVGFSDG